MKEFIIEYKGILNLAEIARRADIKGNLLQQIAAEIPYRHLSEDQEEKIKAVLLPIIAGFEKRLKKV